MDPKKGTILGLTVFRCLVLYFLQIKIIVAGGCKNWCLTNPPISSAEMYHPQNDSWTQLPDLPMPISGGKMIELKGKPTIVAGRAQFDDTTTESNLLISYDYETNSWIEDGKINIPRSNHAVMQIPKTFIPSCFL